MVVTILLIELIFIPILAYIFAKIIGIIAKDGMTMDENIVYKITSITNDEGETKLTARREFPELLDSLGSIILGKISLDISQGQESIEICYSKRGTTINSLIANEQISSISYGTKRHVLLRNMSIVMFFMGILLAPNLAYIFDGSLGIILFVPLVLMPIIAYLIFRASVLEIQESGGKKVLFRFSGDAEMNGLSDFTKSFFSNSQTE